ncbi:MAG: spore germination protein [Cellulosilyticaceae bacterium]
MDVSKDIHQTLRALKSKLPVGNSFDLLEKKLEIHDKTFYLYFIDGLIKDINIEYIRRDIYTLKPEDFNKIHTAKDLINLAISCAEVAEETDLDKIITAVLAGQTALFCDGFSAAILIDLRTYPARGPEEPAKEKTLRGARDGFVETIVFNTALLRRRIRDPHLVFEMVQIGIVSKTDVAIGYMGNKVDKKALKIIKEKLSALHVDALTIGDQSLVEAICSKSWLNPFPKVRYSERPDVAAAHIMEGKVILIIDNTPCVMILPTTIFDFLQDINDYYMPVLTGNYLRFVRNIVLLVNLFIIPTFILMVDNASILPEWLKFTLPQDPYVIPLFIQFLMLEVAIDGLKIASLNTPDSLGTSLSTIGGLILGEYAIKTGWFIPHSILYMAVVALSSFTQPSIELSYAIKFLRIILIISTGLLGTWGFIIGFLVNIAILASTKTFTGEPYLYPLIPFNWSALKHLLFRTKLTEKQQSNNP